MYPKFIELHGGVTGQTLSANVAHIVMFSDREIVLSNEPMSRDGKAFNVTESYNDMKTLIKDCGCLIHKQDPRLDTTTPLTLDDLREMVGEPVWNSNNGRWYLVWLINEFDTDRPVHLRYRDGVMLSMSADDLMKYPLYRMKRELKE